MTPEPPPPPGRRARPGPEVRRQALEVGVGAVRVGGRETLRDSLSRIPDITSGQDAVVVAPPPTVAGNENRADHDNSASEPEPDLFAGPQTTVVTAAPPSPPPAGGRGRRDIPFWRRVAFALVLAGLVAAIPVLGYVGFQVVTRSTDGKLVNPDSNPKDPGYEAQVEPTPTAVVIQYGTDGKPIGTTFLSLTDVARGGGGVVFVPLDTEVARPGLGIIRLLGAYTAVEDRPVRARDQLATEIGKLLNVGVGEVVELDDAGWGQLVAPVAPIAIDNPETVDIGDGVVVPVGPVMLTADQVGPYLRAQKFGESGQQRLNRSETFWTAWLAAVRSRDAATAVPGETNAGMGRFIPSLAKGEVTQEILPVDRIADASGRYRIRKQDVQELVTKVVPAPTPASPGSRFTVRLLDGVAPGTIPPDVIRQVVFLGGSVSIIGNGPRFGEPKTTIVYADPARRTLAKVVLESLGGIGAVRLDREAPDTVDLTIVLGADVLGETPTGTDSATSTPTSGGN